MLLLTIQEGNEQQVIRNLLDNTYSYLEMEEQIKENNSTIHDVVILNQYQDICFFLFYPDRVTVISPYIHICDNKTIFLCCMAEELGSCTSHVCHLLYSEKTNRILYAPKVLYYFLIKLFNNLSSKMLIGLAQQCTPCLPLRGRGTAQRWRECAEIEGFA